MLYSITGRIPKRDLKTADSVAHCEIIEKYPSDTRGESCLVYGDTPENIPVHIVCGKNSQNHLFIITVYIPKMPKWLNPRVRNR
ncbi:MAG: DUF4258 domain-containing protein [Desulfobacteraceae bacterium]|nr:DUF4258 domain-containing protein [Desulfobacteraceae bacterium]